MSELIPKRGLYIVRVENFSIDEDYAAWLSDIIQRYRSAQIKAALKVNTESWLSIGLSDEIL